MPRRAKCFAWRANFVTDPFAQPPDMIRRALAVESTLSESSSTKESRFDPSYLLGSCMMEIPGMTTRRQFLNTAAVASGSALIAQSALPDLAWGATPSPMNILILGGTGYIGAHLVRLAVSRGHKVTTFTRGSPQT